MEANGGAGQFLPSPARGIKLKITITVSTMMVGISLLTAALCAGILVPISRDFSLARSRKHVTNLANLASQLLDPAEVREIRSAADQKGKRYRRLQTLLNDVVNNIDGAGYAYIWRIRPAPAAPHGIQVAWVVDNVDQKSNQFQSFGSEYQTNTDSAPTLLQVARTKRAASNPSYYVDDFGTWISGYAPISIDERNGDMLVVGIDISAQHIQDWQSRLVRIIAVATGLSLLLAIPIGIIAGHWMCQPLKIITRRLGNLSQLDLTENPTPIAGTWVDEIQQLCKASMSLDAAMRSFALYLPQDVVRKLLASDQVARLGGAQKEVAVMFTDIRGFTSYAETTEVQALLARLNQYFNLVTQEIVATSGTVDKFIGDSVMGFWGAPSEQPKPASQACLAALGIRRIRSELREQWQGEADDMDFFTRIGIHYGQAVIGNMGSDTRINYTAVGDTVNTASRLEGLGKNYATDILVSRSVVDAVAREGEGAKFLFTRIDEVCVRGKHVSTEIFSLDLAPDRESSSGSMG